MVYKRTSALQQRFPSFLDYIIFFTSSLKYILQFSLLSKPYFDLKNIIYLLKINVFSSLSHGLF